MYDYAIIATGFLFLIIIFIYMYIKDSEVNRKFYLYEKAIEDLNKKIYTLEKNSKNTKKKIDIDEIREYIDEKIEENIEKITSFVVESHNKTENSIKEIMNSLTEKMNTVDEKIKKYSTLPDTYQSNDKRVVSLYNKGLTVSEIAKNLRMGIGEVELVLKIAGIK